MTIDLLTFDEAIHWFDKSFEYPIKKKFRLPKCFKKTFYLNELFNESEPSMWNGDEFIPFWDIEESYQVDDNNRIITEYKREGTIDYTYEINDFESDSKLHKTRIKKYLTSTKAS